MPKSEPGYFTTTHWSVILAAGDSSSPEAAQALDQLCQTYWYPLYAYIRRHGYSPEDAQDLTQDFFARFLQKHSIASADKARGKFRTFLLSALKNSLINHQKNRNAARRGGGQIHFSIDAERAEDRYVAEPAHDLSPEKLFEKRWAAIFIKEALQRVRMEYAQQGNQPLFEKLKDHLWGERETSYTDMAQAFGMNEGSVKAAAFRLRKRLRQIMRSLVAETVARPDEIEAELQALLEAFGQ